MPLGQQHQHHILAPRPVRVSSGPILPHRRIQTPDRNKPSTSTITNSNHSRRRSSISNSPTIKAIFNDSELDSSSNLICTTPPPRSPFNFHLDTNAAEWEDELFTILRGRVPPPSPSPEHSILFPPSRTGSRSSGNGRSSASRLSRRRSLNRSPPASSNAATAGSPTFPIVGWLCEPFFPPLVVS